MKKIITKIMLFVLPFMAVVLSTTGDSVQLIKMADGSKITGSFFVMLNDSTLAILPMLAATCGIVSCIAAALYLILKKKGIFKVTCWASFAGACLSVIPVAVRGESLLLPNVAFPILLFAHFIVCAFSKNMDLSKKDEPQGRRLERR